MGRLGFAAGRWTPPPAEAGAPGLCAAAGTSGRAGELSGTGCCWSQSWGRVLWGGLGAFCSQFLARLLESCAPRSNTGVCSAVMQQEGFLATFYIPRYAIYIYLFTEISLVFLVLRICSFRLPLKPTEQHLRFYEDPYRSRRCA